MKSKLLIAVLFTASAAQTQTQTLKVVPVHLDESVAAPKTIQFFCSQDYNRRGCLKDAITLRQVLVAYPLRQLGEWSFVLVANDDWRTLVRSMGGIPESPAFSAIDQRLTLLDRSLFYPSPARSAELLQMFKIGRAHV